MRPKALQAALEPLPCQLDTHISGRGVGTPRSAHCFRVCEARTAHPDNASAHATQLLPGWCAATAQASSKPSRPLHCVPGSISSPSPAQQGDRQLTGCTSVRGGGSGGRRQFWRGSSSGAGGSSPSRQHHGAPNTVQPLPAPRVVPWRPAGRGAAQLDAAEPDAAAVAPGWVRCTPMLRRCCSCCCCTSPPSACPAPKRMRAACVAEAATFRAPPAHPPFAAAVVRVCADGGANRLYDELPAMLPGERPDAVRVACQCAAVCGCHC